MTTPPAPAVSPEAAAAQLLNQITLGYILSSLLNVALELEIADHLADGPRSTADLAKATGVTEDRLYHVLAGAAPLIDAAGVRDRCETASGDFFNAVPHGGDAYIMKNIIHDWDDDRAIAILPNIRAAFEGRPEGRVILLEAVIPPGNQPDVGKLIDIEMLLMPGGRERTAEEFASLFERAGFELTRIVPTESPLSVVEAVVR